MFITFSWHYIFEIFRIFSAQTLDFARSGFQILLATVKDELNSSFLDSPKQFLLLRLLAFPFRFGSLMVANFEKFTPYTERSPR